MKILLLGALLKSSIIDGLEISYDIANSKKVDLNSVYNKIGQSVDCFETLSVYMQM